VSSGRQIIVRGSGSKHKDTDGSGTSSHAQRLRDVAVATRAKDGKDAGSSQMEWRLLGDVPAERVRERTRLGRLQMIAHLFSRYGRATR
jgi:hypothetical protein